MRERCAHKSSAPKSNRFLTGGALVTAALVPQVEFFVMQQRVGLYQHGPAQDFLQLFQMFVLVRLEELCYVGMHAQQDVFAFNGGGNLASLLQNLVYDSLDAL